MWGLQSNKIIELVLHHEVSVKYFFLLSAYIYPTILFHLLPISTVCTTLLVLSKLRHTKEIQMMYGIGVSTAGLKSPIALFACICTGLHFILSLYLMPVSFNRFEELEKTVKEQVIPIENGVFTTYLENIVVYVNKRIGRNKFTGIFIYDAREPTKNVIITAEFVEIFQHNRNIVLQLRNGFYQENEGVSRSMLFFENYKMTMELKENMQIKEGASNGKYLNEILWGSNENISPKFRIDGHNRILWPMYNLLVAMLAASVLLRPSSSSEVVIKKRGMERLGGNAILPIVRRMCNYVRTGLDGVKQNVMNNNRYMGIVGFSYSFMAILSNFVLQNLSLISPIYILGSYIGLLAGLSVLVCGMKNNTL